MLILGLPAGLAPIGTLALQNPPPGAPPPQAGPTRIVAKVLLTQVCRARSLLLCSALELIEW